MKRIQDLTQQQKKTAIIAGAVLLLALAVYATRDSWTPVPDNTTYSERNFSFEYPRANEAEEYGAGVVSIGETPEGGAFGPLVEVVRYRNDPDAPRPPTFNAFVLRQAQAICGADSPTESVTCSGATSTAYTSPQGLTGQKVTMTLTKKNLRSGTTTVSSFEPIYVFNTTQAATPPEVLRYQAIFVYPSLDSILADEPATDLLGQIIGSLVLPDGVSSVVK